MNQMRILMSCGGTGGHINPALNIASEIKNKYPQAVIEFVGAEKGLENILIPKEGYKIHYTDVIGFKRSLSPKNIKALIKAVTSVLSAKKIIKEFKPDIVIGTGGYASWPAVRAAAKLGIPTLIQEQNAYPGVTTKKLSAYVNTVCISFSASEEYFNESVKNKLVLTGNPIKKNVISRQEARRTLGINDETVYILSTGGSLGAEKVNEFVLEAMKINEKLINIRHTHAIGRTGYEKFNKIAGEKGLINNRNYEIVEYIYDMPIRQAAADIIINRAGAMTTSELAALGGKAAIFIPSPNVTEDHQYKNAMVLKNMGAAEVFRESVLNGRILAKTIKDLINDFEKRNRMAENMGKFGKPDAINHIINEVEKLLEK